jgi:hypothetical protein
MFENPVVWTIFTIVAACAAAWGGAKYALSSHETKLKEHDAQFFRVMEELQKRVLISDCRDERGDCRSNRESTYCELNRKIDRIFTAIEEQEKKREAGKDVYQAMFRDLAIQIAAMKTILDERKSADDRHARIDQHNLRTL